MADSLSGILRQYWDEWTTGRKIGIKYDISDPLAESENDRGGEFYQLPMIELEGSGNSSISRVPLEYGKNYSDNKVYNGAVVNVRVCFTNGYVSQVATNALLAVQKFAGREFMENSIFKGLELMQTLLKNPILCDITTNLHFYKNMTLTNFKPRETYNTGSDWCEADATFEEVLIMKPVEFELTEQITVNSVVKSNAKKTAKAVNNVKKDNDLKLYQVNAGGKNFMCRPI